LIQQDNVQLKKDILEIQECTAKMAKQIEFDFRDRLDLFRARLQFEQQMMQMQNNELSRNASQGYGA
jgi:hypothetical protein